LAIIRCRVVLAAPIVERYIILRVGHFPDVHIAIGLVISIRLGVRRAPEPPRRAICSSPRGLAGVVGVHSSFAPSATVVRSRDIENPMWVPQWSAGREYNFPIFPTRRGEDLHTFGTTVLVPRLARSPAILALYERTC